MEKEIAIEVIKTYISGFKRSAEFELSNALQVRNHDTDFLKGQIDACEWILKNMELTVK